MSVLLYARLIQVDQPRSVIQYYTFNNLRTDLYLQFLSIMVTLILEDFRFLRNSLMLFFYPLIYNKR